MSNEFKEFLRKIGSGPHTGENLTRQEAEKAMEMMLRQEATPAQIGAFLIAHRIKRPTGEELAGMLDAYDRLGQKLQPINSQPKNQQQVMVFSSPYDGRSRTAPISPLTALILATAGQPVILHGGDRMPTKEGTPLIDIWQGLGINWRHFSIDEMQQVFANTNLGFVYLPQHFPLAYNLVTYREQIGKRPPISTLELIWSPYNGATHLVSGFVHPPTENMFRDAFTLRGIPQRFTTVKGLEGSCDIPRDRTAIIGLGEIKSDSQVSFERFLLHPRDYHFEGTEIPLSPINKLVEDIHTVLQGQSSELMKAAIGNGGFYLWRCGMYPDISSGLAAAENLLTTGQVAKKLEQINQTVASIEPLACRNN